MKDAKAKKKADQASRGRTLELFSNRKLVKTKQSSKERQGGVSRYPTAREIWTGATSQDVDHTSPHALASRRAKATRRLRPTVPLQGSDQVYTEALSADFVPVAIPASLINSTILTNGTHYAMAVTAAALQGIASASQSLTLAPPPPEAILSPPAPQKENNNYVPFVTLLLISALCSFMAVCILLWRSSANASMQLIITMGFATCLNCFSFFMTGLFHGFNLDRKEAAVWFSWMQGSLITFTEVIIFSMGCAISHLIYERGVLLKGWNKFLKADESKKRVKIMIIGSFIAAALFTGLEAFLIHFTGNTPLGLFSIRPEPPWTKSISATIYLVATLFVVYRSMQILRSQIAASRELAKLSGGQDYLDALGNPNETRPLAEEKVAKHRRFSFSSNASHLPSKARRYSSDNHSFVSLPWSKRFQTTHNTLPASSPLTSSSFFEPPQNGPKKRSSVGSVASMTSSGSGSMISTLYLRLLIATLLYAFYAALIAASTIAYVMTSIPRYGYKERQPSLTGLADCASQPILCKKHHYLAPEVGPREYATSVIGIVFFLVFATTPDARKAYVPARLEDHIVSFYEWVKKAWRRRAQMWRRGGEPASLASYQDALQSGEAHPASLPHRLLHWMPGHASQRSQSHHASSASSRGSFLGRFGRRASHSGEIRTSLEAAGQKEHGEPFAPFAAETRGNTLLPPQVMHPSTSGEVKWRNSVYSDSSSAILPGQHAHLASPLSTTQKARSITGSVSSASSNTVSTPPRHHQPLPQQRKKSSSYLSVHSMAAGSPSLGPMHNVAFHVGDELDFLDPNYFKALAQAQHGQVVAPFAQATSSNNQTSSSAASAHSVSLPLLGGVAKTPAKPARTHSLINTALATLSSPFMNTDRPTVPTRRASKVTKVSASSLPVEEPRAHSYPLFSPPQGDAVPKEMEGTLPYMTPHFANLKYGRGRRGSDTPIADPMALHPMAMSGASGFSPKMSSAYLHPVYHPPSSTTVHPGAVYDDALLSLLQDGVDPVETTPRSPVLSSPPLPSSTSRTQRVYQPLPRRQPGKASSLRRNSFSVAPSVLAPSNTTSPGRSVSSVSPLIRRVSPAPPASTEDAKSSEAGASSF